MENFGLKDLIYIGGLVITAVITFFSTKHKIKEYIRDKHDELKDQINGLKLDIKDLKSKDDLQQQVINQMGGQIENLMTKLSETVNKKKHGRNSF